VPAGLIAAAVGAGLGLRHLQKTGLSVGTVVGLALLAGGAVLLAGGVVGLWRRASGLRRLWFVPGTVAGLAFGFSLAIAVMATVVPPTPVYGSTPREHGLAAAEVVFGTDDGVRLSAWWTPSSNGAAVVLLHGAGENRAAPLPQATVLADAGYGVLLLDARGHGRSGGRGMDFGWYGDGDVRAAVDFVARQDGVAPDRIGLLGLSMGGEEALGAAAAEPRVRAVVAEGATGRTAEDKAAWLPGGVPGALQRALDRLTYGLVDLLTQASPPTALTDAVRAARQAEFLLVTAGTMPDEARAAAVLAAAAPDRVQVWTVPDARHTHALQADPGAWRARVVAFLDDRLGG
jgi:pimeloyl-ACP methyl ester carboxylesterase